MATRPRAYEQKTYEEWRDESWAGAREAVEELVVFMKKEGFGKLKMGKPFDIEIDLSIAPCPAATTLKK